MAACKHCGGEVSPAADACPHCGHPTVIGVMGAMGKSLSGCGCALMLLTAMIAVIVTLLV